MRSDQIIHNGYASEQEVIDWLKKNRTSGPGIMEYLEKGNIMEYSPSSFSLKEFEELIQKLWS